MAKVPLQINDTMRVLTIFTVILLPLTLIAGVWGMNGLDLNKFDTLPTGFLLVIIMMACVGGGLLDTKTRVRTKTVTLAITHSKMNRSAYSENSDFSSRI